MLPLFEIYFVSNDKIIGQGWDGELQTGRMVEEQRIRHIMGKDVLKKKAEKEEKVPWINKSHVQLGFAQAMPA